MTTLITAAKETKAVLVLFLLIFYLWISVHCLVKRIIDRLGKFGCTAYKSISN